MLHGRKEFHTNTTVNNFTVWPHFFQYHLTIWCSGTMLCRDLQEPGEAWGDFNPQAPSTPPTGAHASSGGLEYKSSYYRAGKFFNMIKSYFVWPRSNNTNLDLKTFSDSLVSFVWRATRLPHHCHTDWPKFKLGLAVCRPWRTPQQLKLHYWPASIFFIKWLEMVLWYLPSPTQRRWKTMLTMIDSGCIQALRDVSVSRRDRWDRRKENFPTGSIQVSLHHYKCIFLTGASHGSFGLCLYCKT